MQIWIGCSLCRMPGETSLYFCVKFFILYQGRQDFAYPKPSCESLAKVWHVSIILHKFAVESGLHKLFQNRDEHN